MGRSEINDSQFIFCPIVSETAVGGILVGVETYRQLTIYCYSLIDRSLSSGFTRVRSGRIWSSCHVYCQKLASHNCPVLVETRNVSASFISTIRPIFHRRYIASFSLLYRDLHGTFSDYLHSLVTNCSNHHV